MGENETVIFDGTELEVVFGEYPLTHHTKIQLMKAGEPLYTATSEIEGATLEEDEVLIKDYSENEGVLETLVRAGIIARPHDKVRAGFTYLHICQLIN